MVDADREKISKSKQAPRRLRKAADRRGLCEEVGRGRCPALGRLAGLPQRHHRQRGAHQQSGRNLPRPAQCPALPALQPLRLRPGEARRARRPADRARPLDPGRVCPVGAGSPRGLRPFEFHVVYQKVSQFVAVELSAIYHDVVKDRLYTDPANSPRRRSTQTALHRMFVSLCKMLAPILAFTADEAWEFVPGKTVDSAHQLTWQPRGFAAARSGAGRLEGSVRAARAGAAGAGEGPAGEANRQGAGGETDLRRLKPRPGSSAGASGIAAGAVECLPTGNPAGGDGAVTVWVSKAAGQKCERCWHWETDVGSHPEHPTICGRCVQGPVPKACQLGRHRRPGPGFLPRGLKPLWALAGARSCRSNRRSSPSR